MPSAASRLMPTLRRVVLAGAGADRTDGQLLGAFVADRDTDAFAGLVRRHGPMVLGVCRRVVGDHTVADDAFQAVFIVLARRAGAVKPREQVGNWLYGVAYRTALKARAVLARRRSREKQVDVMPEPPVSPGTSADWADLQPLIDEELARLPDKLRVPVVLCDLEGRAQRDVAKHLGIPPATLATRIASARRMLAARLTKRGVTLSGGALAGLLSANGTASAVPYALGQGVLRAVESVAGGGVVSSLVSAHAVQLSEGVMRMMLLTKLKAVAVTVLSVAALTGGLGLGLVPAYALATGEESARTQNRADRAAEMPRSTLAPLVAVDDFIDTKLKQASIELTADVDDATFLRRLSLDLRGLPPTDVETFFFISDEDEGKRAKVVVWMSDDDEVKAHAAKKLGIPAERLRIARLVDLGDGRPRRLVIVVDAEEKSQALAFTPDGKSLTVDLLMDNKDVRVAPLILDAVTGTNLNVGGPGIVDLAVTKDAKEAEVKGEIIRLQGNVTNARNGEILWALIGDDRKTVTGRTFTNSGAGGGVHGLTFTTGDDDGKSGDTFWVESQALAIQLDSDADFLKRVIKDVRGGAPTALEEKYFADDKDPKKREKLLDALLKDPAVAKKVGDDWKKRMLATTQTKEGTYRYRVVPKIVDPAQGTGKWIPQSQSFDFKHDGGTYKLQVVPAFDTKSGKLELKVDPQLRKEGVFEWKIAPTDPKSVKVPKEGGGDFEWKVVPTINPKVPRPPATPKSPETPKVRSVKVVPPAPAKPAAPPKPKPATAAATAGKLDRAIGALIAGNKSDADILDFITLDVLGRLPTDAEKKLTLRLVSKAADRKAAWLEVARVLAETGEGRQRSDAADRTRLESKDVDLDVIEVTGAVKEVGGVLRLQVNPEARPELKPKTNPKPIPPEKK